MSSDKETTDYIELRPGDKVQVGDQWLDQFGQWHFYTHAGDTAGVVGSGVKARRPIPATHQATYEEVPGSRTTQDTVVQPQRERIAYEELRPGTEVQAGDQYRNTQGRWVEYAMDTSGVPIVGSTTMARRPYKISAILEIGDALANAQEAATQLQDDRDEACRERDLARSEVARLSTELWARKPLEDRVSSLTEELTQAREGNQQLQGERDELQAALRESHAAHEFTMKQRLAAIAERNEAERLLAEAQMERDKAWSDQKVIQAYRDTALQELTQAREASQQLLQTIADNADQFAWASKTLEQQRDEARAEVQRLQEVVGNLYNEPTARQVQDMLRTWATELDWSAGCFDSVGRDEIDTIQRTLIAVIERIEGMTTPEGGTDDN